MHAQVWPVVSLINYRYIPLRLRVLFVNAIALFWCGPCITISFLAHCQPVDALNEASYVCLQVDIPQPAVADIRHYLAEACYMSPRAHACMQHPAPL
jgi:hypothetical protein